MTARHMATMALGDAAEPFILPFAGTLPEFATPPAFCGPGAAVLGRATLGRNARLGASSVIRADGHFVRRRRRFRARARSTVHIAHEDLSRRSSATGSAVGENAVVHACTLGSDVVVGDGAVILDGSVVGDRVVIEAHAIVFPRSELEGGKLYAGMPARPVRDLRPGEIEERAARAPPRMPSAGGRACPRACRGRHRRKRLRGADGAASAAASSRRRIPASGSAATLDANGGEIVIGENTNIQDNTVIRCRPGERFAIGADSTIGHNVTLGDCTIGARSLIGIGSVVADGTVVGTTSSSPRGAETTPGQVLEARLPLGQAPGGEDGAARRRRSAS